MESRLCDDADGRHITKEVTHLDLRVRVRACAIQPFRLRNCCFSLPPSVSPDSDVHVRARSVLTP